MRCVSVVHASRCYDWSVTAHALDNPIWFALTTEQRSFARGDELALRYEADVAPFVAIERDTPATRTRARELIDLGESVYFVGMAPSDFTGWTVLSEGFIFQMVWQPSPLVLDDRIDTAELGQSDAPAMVALTELAFPGFFRRRTYALGRYFGVKRSGALVAMAGERMRAAGFQEISAVCTHPQHVGRGYAAHLSALLIRMILDRNVQPFLHVGSANARAQALYSRLGFHIRAELGLWYVRRER